MRKGLLLICVLLSFQTFAQPPINDSCFNAIRLCSGAVYPIGKTTFNGTTEGYDSCTVESKSTWFFVEGFKNGRDFTITVTALDSICGIEVSIFDSGCGGVTLGCFTVLPDSFNSITISPTDSGRRYMIQVNHPVACVTGRTFDILASTSNDGIVGVTEPVFTSSPVMPFGQCDTATGFVTNHSIYHGGTVIYQWDLEGGIHDSLGVMSWFTPDPTTDSGVVHTFTFPPCRTYEVKLRAINECHTGYPPPLDFSNLATKAIGFVSAVNLEPKIDTVENVCEGDYLGIIVSGQLMPPTLLAGIVRFELTVTDKDSTTLYIFGDSTTPKGLPIPFIQQHVPLVIIVDTIIHNLNDDGKDTVYYPTRVGAGTITTFLQVFGNCATSEQPCPDTVTNVFSIDPAVQMCIGVSDTSPCFGDSVTLSNLCHQAGQSYDWFKINPLDTLGLNDSSLITVTPNGVTNYYGVAYSGNCSITSDTISSGGDSTNVVITATQDSVCGNDFDTLFANGATLFAWIPTPPSFIQCYNGPICDTVVVRPDPAISGWITYTVFGTTGSCTDIDSISIYAAAFAAPDAGPDTIICYGSSILLSGSNNTSDLFWSDNGANGSFNDNMITKPVYTPHPDSSGTFLLTMLSFDTLGFCPTSNIDSMILTIDTAIVVSVSSYKDTICENEFDTLVASGALIYSWTGSPVMNCIDTTACSMMSVNPPATGLHTYTVIGTFGSCQDSASIVLYENVSTSLSTSVLPDTLCKGSTYSFTVTGSNTGYWISINSSAFTLVDTTNQVTGQIPITFPSATYTIAIFALPCPPDTLMLSFFIDTCTTGIFDPISELNFSIHPNPTAGLFQIEFSQVLASATELTISDLLGKVLLRKDLSPGLSNYSIDMAKQANGIYFVKLTAMDHSVIRKLMKR